MGHLNPCDGSLYTASHVTEIIIFRQYCLLVEKRRKHQFLAVRTRLRAMSERNSTFLWPLGQRRAMWHDIDIKPVYQYIYDLKNLLHESYQIARVNCDRLVVRNKHFYDWKAEHLSGGWRRSISDAAHLHKQNAHSIVGLFYGSPRAPSGLCGKNEKKSSSISTCCENISDSKSPHIWKYKKPS